MTQVNLAEVHCIQYGLTDSEIEECYLNNGVLEQSRTIYCFKKDEDDYSPSAVYLFNHHDEGKKVMGDDLNLMLHSSDSSLTEFFEIPKDAMTQLIWMAIWNGDEDVIPDNFSGEKYVEEFGSGGEINITDIEADLKAAKESCLISFSQFANCNFEMSEDLMDLAIPDLDYSRNSDKLEVARIYYGDASH
jgi:hypothetical protein